MTARTGIDIDHYRYELPDSRIAKYPLESRDASKLLIYNRGELYHLPFRELPRVIPEGSWLVFNDTRVIQARLLFTKGTGARIEIFCIEPSDPPEYQQSFRSQTGCTWKCMVGNARKWKSGPVSLTVETDDGRITIEARMIGREQNQTLIRFTWDDERLTFGELLEKAGNTPIPPYLNREAEEEDRERYQTIYSRTKGSVAAPTAGLHFTNELLNRLKSSGLRMEEITLHVGAGTFVPVKEKDARAHIMHAETASVSRRFLERWLHDPEDLIAVGTTSTRSLESLYWLGVKLIAGAGGAIPSPDPFRLKLGQWEDHTLPWDVPLKESLEGLLGHCRRYGVDQLLFSTRLMIVPGYRFRTISGLLTNFHLPGSTLLLLVAALIGEEWRTVYDYAMDHRFRFLSYGDSSLLIPG